MPVQCGPLAGWLLGAGVTIQTPVTVLILMLENCAAL